MNIYPDNPRRVTSREVILVYQDLCEVLNTPFYRYNSFTPRTLFLQYNSQDQTYTIQEVLPHFGHSAQVFHDKPLKARDFFNWCKVFMAGVKAAHTPVAQI